MSAYSSIELCAGGGGQALGLEMAGFRHVCLLEYEPDFCKTLHLNRPDWDVRCGDIRNVDLGAFPHCDLLAGGVPCPPFSIAGKQEGERDERNMFPAALAIARATKPRGVLFENVKGLASAKFADYRQRILDELREMGYEVASRVLEASDFGVPQLRPRFFIVALRPEDMRHFRWPVGARKRDLAETFADLLHADGWGGAKETTARLVGKIAPTLVGGSKKHGGPDLGPTRAKRAWAELGFQGNGIANTLPSGMDDADCRPKLTLRMAARVQGFPDDWRFWGTKTVQYRQIGNALPPPVAFAVGRAIIEAFERSDHAQKEKF